MSNVSGGFIAFRAITVEEQEMFDRVMEMVMGVKYESFAVATQVVSGTNYAFFCNALQVGKDEREAFNALVVIHKPLPGVNEPPSLLRISKAEVVEKG